MKSENRTNERNAKRENDMEIGDRFQIKDESIALTQ